MNIQFNKLFKDPQTNWKYILIVVILTFFVGGGILGYCYWWLPKQEIPIIQISTIKKPEKIEEITKPLTIAGLLNDSRLKHVKEIEVLDKYAYVVGEKGLVIIDVSNPRNPVIVNSIDIPGIGLSISDKYVYVIGFSVLTTVDISNPISPKVISSFQDLKLPGRLQDIEVRGQYAYIINDSWRTLIIIDISDSKNPKIVSSILVIEEEYVTSPMKIYPSDNYCYIVSWNGWGNNALTIIDISDPKNPKKSRSFSDGKLEEAINIFVSDKYAYIITGANILAIIDIFDPTTPLIVSSIEDKRFYFGRKVYILDKYAYVIGRKALTVIDISNPKVPQIITSISEPKFERAEDLYVLGRYGYVISPELEAFVIIDIKGEITFTGKAIPILSREVLDFEEKFIEKNEREIAFLQDGDIWLLSKDLKKKYKITEEEYKAIISPGEEKDYWIEDGELLKRKEGDGVEILVSKKEMEEKFQDLSFWEMESFHYLKGEVMSFSLSPDKEYIAYETLEGYTACCLAPPTMPTTWIRIMRNDGTKKTKIEEPPERIVGNLIERWGWIPDSQIIFVQFTYYDTPTTGSPFYKFGVDGRYLGIFPIRESDEFSDTIVKLGADPIFSPDGTKMAYADLDGQEIEIGLATLEKGEIKERKKILEADILYVGSASEILNWSEDGSLLLVRGINKVFIFNSKGEIISEIEFKEAEKIKDTILSPNNKYLGGVYKMKGERINIIFFINLATKEKKEFKLPTFEDISETIYIYPKFFSNSNRFYYLINIEGLETEIKESFPQLWVVDTDTWKNYKVADNVSQVVRVP